MSEPIDVALGMERSDDWPTSEAGPSLLKPLPEMAGKMGCPRMLGWPSSSLGVLPESLLPHRSADTPSTTEEAFWWLKRLQERASGARLGGSTFFGGGKRAHLAVLRTYSRLCV